MKKVTITKGQLFEHYQRRKKRFNWYLKKGYRSRLPTKQNEYGMEIFDREKALEQCKLDCRHCNVAFKTGDSAWKIPLGSSNMIGVCNYVYIHEGCLESFKWTKKGQNFLKTDIDRYEDFRRFMQSWIGDGIFMKDLRYKIRMKYGLSRSKAHKRLCKYLQRDGFLKATAIKEGKRGRPSYFIHPASVKVPIEIKDRKELFGYYNPEPQYTRGTHV